MLTGDTYPLNNNSLLDQSGIHVTSLGGYLNETITDIAEHTITENVETIILTAYGTTCTVSTPAVSLMRNNSGESVMAISTLGSGQVVYLANETNSSSSLDGRTLVLNAASFIAGATGWLSADPTSGSIPAGSSEIVTVTLDATEQVAGLLSGTISVNSNDLSNGSQDVPVKVTILGSPAISSNFTSYDFGNSYVGGSYSIELILSNPGTDLLTITSGSFTGSTFSTSATFPLSIPAKGEQRISVVYSPSAIASYNDSLVLLNDSPTQSNYSVDFSGSSVTAPDISLSPTSISVSVPFNSSHTETIEISNTGGDDLVWTVHELENAPSTHSSADHLVATLTSLNENYTSITSLVPNLYAFTDGDSGSSIIDGGNDMYDGGNLLNTNLSLSDITYSDDTIIADSAFGTNGAYFTKKYPGLFVLGASLNAITSFEISGNLGADGLGSTDTATLTHTHRGIEYTGFVKRVYDTSDPSVNHLIIVPSDQSQSQVASTTTDSDQHEIHGLSNSDTLYYLLFASSSGNYVDDNSMQQIMETFLSQTASDFAWVSVDQYDGTNSPLESQEIEVLFNSSELTSGSYTGYLQFDSNDPDEPETFVDLTMTVTPRPILSVNETTVDFGNVTNNSAAQRVLEITNTGDQSLTISELTYTSTVFSSPSSTPLTIQPGETHNLPIVCSPNTLGSHSATLTITHNSTGGSSNITLEATAVNYIGIASSPASLSYTLDSGTLVHTSLELHNSYLFDVNFETHSELNDDSLDTSLDGIHVGIIHSSSVSTYLTDILHEEGASTSPIYYSSTLTQELLNDYDLIIVDSYLEYMSSSNRTVLQNWLNAGGRLFIHNGSSLHSDQSLLLANYGVGISQHNTSSTPGSQWSATSPPHPIAEAAGTLSLNDSTYSNLTTYTISDPAKAEVIYTDDRTHHRAVAASYLDGKVISMSASATSTQFSSSAENTFYLKKCFAWLTNSHLAWIQPNFVTGTILADGNLDYPLTISAENLNAGTYSANLIFENSDTGTSELTVPINLVVTGSPNLASSHQELLFEELMLSENDTKILTLTNTGTSALTISSIDSSDSVFSSDFTGTVTIDPSESIGVAITFTPTIAQLYQETLTITSDDPETPSYEISLYGSALGAPELVSPTSLSLTLASGSSSSTTFSIGNTGAATLDWLILPSTPASTLPLSQILQSLTSYSEELLSALPSVYEFSGGDTGDDILDGGDDMYNTGNEIETNYDYSIPYSDFNIQSSNGDFGPNGAYFTAKLPGLFILCADLDGVTRFAIDGGIGGGTGGTVSTGEFTHSNSNIEYKIYTKRIFGKSSPSVNHIIILENGPGLSRTAQSLTNYDDHAVTGIENHSRIYYMILGQDEGGEITDTELQSIAQKFIQLISIDSTQSLLQFSSSNGSTTASSSTSVTATVNAQALYAGDYTYQFYIDSNDLNTPLVSVPLNVTVTGSPKIATPTNYINFPATVIGLESDIVLDIHNTGSDQLNISGYNFSNSLFSSDATPIAIAPGESTSLTLTYTPSTSGFEQGSLTILSDATNDSDYEILLSGIASIPPVADVDTTTRTFTLGASTSLISNFDIANSGSNLLNWNAHIDYGITSNSIGTPQYDGLKILAVDYSSTNSYASLQSYVEECGGTLDEVRADEFTTSQLSSYDVLILGPSTYLSPAKYVDINTWISNGGALLFDMSATSSTYISALLSGSGISATYDTASSTVYDQLPYHSITQGVSNIYGYKYLTFQTSGDAVPLVHTVDQDIYAAASTIGSGKIVALADSLADSSINSHDNRQFIENALLWLGNKQRGWISLQNHSGSITQGDTVSVAYEIDSSSLTVGTYTADIVITTNDPSQLELRIPVNITVSTNAEIQTNIDAIYFSPCIVGTSSGQELTISNPGYTPLVINSVDFIGQFSTNSSFPITIDPNDSVNLEVTYTPTSIGFHEGSLTINSNALTYPAKAITLQGVGSESPTLQLSVDTLTVIAEINDISPQSILISNTGSGVLEWDIRSSHNLLPSVSTDHLIGKNIGILSSQSSATSVFQTSLDSYGANVIQVASELNSSALDTLDLLIYDGTFSLSSNSLAVLDQWVMGGGSFLACDDYYYYMRPVLSLFGCDILSHYRAYSTPISPTGNHITLSDVTTINAYYPDAKLTLSESATPLILFADNEIAGAHLEHGSGEVILLSYEAMSSSNFRSGDGEKFITNCAAYLTDTLPWLSLPQTHGFISPNEADTTYLNIDTTNLTEGIYEGYLIVDSNDPMTPSQSISLTLTVVPEFPSSLYASWITEQLPSATEDVGFSDDYDGDGLTNGEEFFFATNPNSTNYRNNLPTIQAVNQGPTISYTRATELSDHMLLWECSTDLNNWTQIDLAEISSNAFSIMSDNGDGTTTVETTLDQIDAESQFFRHKIWSEYDREE